MRVMILGRPMIGKSPCIVDLRPAGQTNKVRRKLRLPLERDDFSSNRHPDLSFCLSMISAQTPRVCREEKSVPTFSDYAPASAG